MGDTKGEYKVGPPVDWVLVWISPILWISIRRDSLISVYPNVAIKFSDSGVRSTL
jgi:hypothetical protein